MRCKLGKELIRPAWMGVSHASRDEIEDVLKITSDYFGVSVERLQFNSRAGKVLVTRRAGLNLAKQVSGATPVEIGQRFGAKTILRCCWRTGVDCLKDEKRYLLVHVMPEFLFASV